MFGNAHFNTFDGMTYTYYSSCNHVLLDVPTEWKITLETDKHCDPRGLCQKQLFIEAHGDQIILGKKEEQFSVTFNDKKVRRFPYHNGDKRLTILVCKEVVFPYVGQS